MWGSWAQGMACPLDGECADRASQHQELQLPPPPYLPVSQPLLETQEKDPAGGQSPIRQEDLFLNFHPLGSLWGNLPFNPRPKSLHGETNGLSFG